MVKGVSKQVIVVHAPEEEMFEQAIFILKKDAVGEGITEEILLQQAKQAIHSSPEREKNWLYGPIWACGGAFLTGLIWLVSMAL